MTKYKLLTAEQVIEQNEAIEKCIKKLDEALGYVVCLDRGEGSIVEFLKNKIYNILIDHCLDNYISENGGGRLGNIYQLRTNTNKE